MPLIACSHCGKEGSVPAQVLGKKLVCKQCQKSFIAIEVPELSIALEGVELDLEEVSLSQLPDFDTCSGLDLDLDSSMLPLTPAAPANQAESKLQDCPDCGQSISKRATSCPHCGCPVSSVGFEVKRCYSCYTSIPGAADICTHCKKALDTRKCSSCGHLACFRVVDPPLRVMCSKCNKPLPHKSSSVAVEPKSREEMCGNCGKMVRPALKVCPFCFKDRAEDKIRLERSEQLQRERVQRPNVRPERVQVPDVKPSACSYCSGKGIITQSRKVQKQRPCQLCLVSSGLAMFGISSGMPCFRCLGRKVEFYDAVEKVDVTCVKCHGRGVP